MLSYNKTKFDGQEPNLGVRLRPLYLKSFENRQYFDQPRVSRYETTSNNETRLSMIDVLTKLTITINSIFKNNRSGQTSASFYLLSYQKIEIEYLLVKMRNKMELSNLPFQLVEKSFHEFSEGDSWKYDLRVKAFI